MSNGRRSFWPDAVPAMATVAVIALAGCGSSASSSGTSTGAGSGASGGASGSSGGGALAADARSAATGDIPDTQVFLLFRSQPPSWSMKYPEGWTQQREGAVVTFRDKNNLVRVSVASGGAPTTSSVASQLKAEQHTNPTLTFEPPRAVSLSSGPAVKAVYTTQSAPNPVTGKRVRLIVDRYELAHQGKVVVVDLGTPKGVDNVDAYRMMINSFRWR